MARMTIGQGLASFGQSIAQGRIREQQSIASNAKIKREQVQAIIDQENKVADQKIKAGEQKLRLGDLELRQKERIASIQKENDALDRQNEINQANQNIFSIATGGSKQTPISGQLLGESLGELPQSRVDTKKNLFALSQIPEADRTPEVNDLISSFEKAEKLGAKTSISPSDTLSSVESPDALVSGVGAIPEQTRPLSIEEQRDNIMEAIRQNPAFHKQDTADQNRMIEQLEASIVDPDASKKRRIEVEQEVANLESTRTTTKQNLQKLKEAEAEMIRLKAGGHNIDAKQLYSAYQSNKSIQSFDKTNAAIEKVRTVADPTKEPTAASDLGLVFGFMRLLDTDSVVREAEQETARGAQEFLGDLEKNGYDIPPALRKWVERAQFGTVFGEKGSKARADFLDVAEGTYRAQAKTAKIYIDQALMLEKDGGFKPGTVVPLGHVKIFDDIFGEEGSDEFNIIAKELAQEAEANKPTQVKTSTGRTVNVTVK